MLTESFATNQGVRLHYLDTLPDAFGLPVLFIPGALGHADHFRTEFDALAPRQCVALSLRGRGRSDAPESGYTFAHHVSDVEAVIAAAHLDRFTLMGYSAGVPYAIEIAARHPDRVAGLLIGDYPALIRKPTPQWAEDVRQRFPDASPRLIEGLLRESEEVELWDRLPLIACPVLVMRGGQPGALLSAEDTARYLRALPNALSVVFDESGHDLASPSPDRYLKTLAAMLAQIDALENT